SIRKPEIESQDTVAPNAKSQRFPGKLSAGRNFYDNGRALTLSEQARRIEAHEETMLEATRRIVNLIDQLQKSIWGEKKLPELLAQVSAAEQEWTTEENLKQSGLKEPEYFREMIMGFLKNLRYTIAEHRDNFGEMEEALGNARQTLEDVELPLQV